MIGQSYIYITYLIAGGHSNLFIPQQEILNVINSLTTEKIPYFICSGCDICQVSQ